jgi:hypothetical protein
MSNGTLPKQCRCELCDGLVSANAYTPCCGKLLCAACAQGTHCPICQTPNVGTANQAVTAPNPAPDDWLEEDNELRVSGYDG